MDVNWIARFRVRAMEELTADLTFSISLIILIYYRNRKKGKTAESGIYAF
jgi:hypothetical protein